MDMSNIVYMYNGILFSHKWNEVLIYATTWMNFEYIMLSKRSQTQNAMYYMIPFIGNVRTGQSIQTGSRLVVARVKGVGLTRQRKEGKEEGSKENELVLNGLILIETY